MLLILIILNFVQLMKSEDCIFSDCSCKIISNNYMIYCRENELNSVNNDSINLIIKSKGIGNLESINNKRFSNYYCLKLIKGFQITFLSENNTFGHYLF